MRRAVEGAHALAERAEILGAGRGLALAADPDEADLALAGLADAVSPGFRRCMSKPT